MRASNKTRRYVSFVILIYHNIVIASTLNSNPDFVAFQTDSKCDRIMAMMKPGIRVKKPYLPDKRRRNQKSHRAVLKALSQLLTEQPFSTISIEAVAERAGVGKQTIYRWYKDKASLFVDLYNSESDSTLRISDHGSLEKELNELIIHTWHFWRDTVSGKAFRHLIASCQSSEQSLDDLREKFMPNRRQYTAQLMERAIARGEIQKANYDVFVDTLVGFNWYRLLTNSLDDESDIPVMVSTLLKGIRFK